MASRRLRNSGLKSRSMRLLAAASSASLRRGRRRSRSCACAHLARAGVRRHDQHDLPEVGLAARVVGQRRVVHHLQQDVEQVGVRLLDLVEQHHAVGVLAHRVHQQAALLEADVARAARRSGARRRASPCTRSCRSGGTRCRGAARAAWRARSCRRRSGPVNRKQPAGLVGLAEARARALDRRAPPVAPPRPGRTPRASATPRACAGARVSEATPASRGCAPCARRRARSRARRPTRLPSLGRVAAAAPRPPRRSRRSRCRAAAWSRRWRRREAGRAPRAPRRCSSRLWCSS